MNRVNNRGTGTLKRQLEKVGFSDIGEIKDATKPITIFINQKDIDKGRAGSPRQCTAAQCLQRALDTKRVAMFVSSAYVQMPNETTVTRYVVPDSLSNNVVRPQDNGGDPIAGTYTLKPPTGSRVSGQSVIRRHKLKLLREQGLAPPPKKQSVVYPRAVRTRWIPTA
jgi:hypothetical protein